MSKPGKMYQDPDWLRRIYWEKRMSMSKMAEVAACSKETIRNWMNRHKIPIRDISEAKSVLWQDLSYREAQERSWTDERRKAQAQQMRESSCKLWSDPAFRKAHSQRTRKRMTELWEDSAFRKAQSQRMSKQNRKLWEDPAFRKAQSQRMSEQSRKLWEEPAYRKARSQRMLELWEDPAYRKAHSQRLSEQNRKRWEDPAYRKAHSQRMSELWEDPAYRAAFFAGVKRSWTDKRREVCARQMRERWMNGHFDGVFQSPTSIEKMTAAALDVLGLVHYSQYRPIGCTFVYDEFIVPHILLEVHGDYWHSLRKAKQRDREKERWAVDHGFHYVVFWEHELDDPGIEALIWMRIVPLLGRGSWRRGL